jgi:diguanylate cyclase (GGDEF)-like protein
MKIFDLEVPNSSQTEIIDQVLKGEIVTAEVMHHRRNGSQFTAEIRATLIEIEKQKYILSFERDVSARKRAEETIMRQARELKEVNATLEQMALTDGLTGLYNRRAFHMRLDDEIKRVTRYQTPLSLLMIDIDYFKLYNDNYGHLAGDKVLQDLSNLLKKYCREADLIVRFGGEEFVVLMPNTDAEGAKILAERIRKEVEQFDWPNRKNTISGGIATLMGDEVSEEVGLLDSWLIAEADRALYYSKYSGRNKVNYVGDIRKLESESEES